MVSRLELPAEFAGQQTWQIRMTVQVAVAHAAAIHDEAVVEQGAVAIRRGLQLLQEVRQQLDVIRIDFGLFRDKFRIVAMMRNGMMLVGDADQGIRTRAEFAGNDHIGLGSPASWIRGNGTKFYGDNVSIETFLPSAYRPMELIDWKGGFI